MGQQGVDSYPVPEQSPLFHAVNAARYERQALIRAYQNEFSCRLAVMIDVIFPQTTTLFEELVYDADPTEDMHLVLVSGGGDGETAIRLVRSAQSRCRTLTVILPDQAKSAATLLALGAHRILMGPAGDLGPVDVQFMLGGDLVPARRIIDAVDDAANKVRDAPETYPLYASLLSDVTAIMVQQARSELARSDELLREALASNPDRDAAMVARLHEALKGPLITTTTSHQALFGPKEAGQIEELPVVVADPAGRQWQMIWRLWAKYYGMGQVVRVYEGARASHILPWPFGEEGTPAED